MLYRQHENALQTVISAAGLPIAAHAHDTMRRGLNGVCWLLVRLVPRDGIKPDPLDCTVPGRVAPNGDGRIGVLLLLQIYTSPRPPHPLMISSAMWHCCAALERAVEDARPHSVKHLHAPPAWTDPGQVQSELAISRHRVCAVRVDATAHAAQRCRRG